MASNLTSREMCYNPIMESINKARVTAEHKGAYKVKSSNGEFLARVTGRQIFNAQSREDFPAVGDWVLIDELPEGAAVIREILPRQSLIKRKRGKDEEVQVIAANIDVAFIVESVGRDYNLNRFERYFAIAAEGGVKPAIILNKTDLISNKELEQKMAEIKSRFPDADVIFTSAAKNHGMDRLRDYIEKDKTYCFLGSSGVGKSFLINKLLGKDLLRTEDISSYSERGRHVTTARQMYFLANGGIVIDNPGIREVGLADDGKGVSASFDEITSLAKDCKFNDCTHTKEPGCCVLEALKAGNLDEGKYNNYINLKKEAEYNEASKIEKKEKERSFGKFIKSAKKTLKDQGHKN